MKVKSESEVAQLCPTLSDPMDCRLSGSSIHGIFQAKVLEWGAIAFSERTNPREYQIVRTHKKGNHLNTRPSVTQPPVAPNASKQQTKQKYKLNHQRTGVPHYSALSIIGKTNKQKLSTSFTLYEAHTNYWTNLRRAESKKEFNVLQGKNSTFLEAWEKETSNTIT